jgi:hypothetical protein
MNIEPIDEFLEKAPDIEQLTDKMNYNEAGFKVSFVFSVIIMLIGGLCAYIVFTNAFSRLIRDIVLLIGFISLPALSMTSALSTWFYYKKQAYLNDINSKINLEKGKSVISVSNFPHTISYLAAAWFILALFIYVIDNYANKIKQFLSFMSNQNSEVVLILFLFLFWITAGLLVIAAAVRYNLHIYTCTYDVFDKQDKVKICKNALFLQFLYVFLFFLLFVSLSTRSINFNLNNAQIEKHVVITAIIAVSYTFCRVIGVFLLYWDIKKRSYDGL